MHFTHSFKKALALIVLFIGVFALTQHFSADAQFGPPVGPCPANTYNVHGELFSSTVGWIYLNCGDAAGSTDFGVKQDSGGYWAGYGWSPEIGWVQFGGLSCPAPSGGTITPAAGSSDCNVHQVLTLTGSGSLAYYPVVGWARAVTALNNPSNTGGWDGWISFSGFNDQNPAAASVQTTGTYGTQANQYVANNHRSVSGFVWGGWDIGWAKFYNAYIDIEDIQAGANIFLTATPNNITGNGVTSLQYTIQAADAGYFHGTATSGCTATTSSTSSTAPWTGSIPGFSSSILIEPAIGNVPVPDASTVYTVTCPVTIPNSPQTSVTASATVTKGTPSVTLSANDNLLCQAGSANGLQSTTLSITAPTNVSYCRLSTDGVLSANHIPGNISSVTVGPFLNATSPITPSQPGDHHAYNVTCYDSANAVVATSTPDLYIGVAPSTYTGTPNCAAANWGIDMGGGNNTILCGAHNSATLSWNPWGAVPSQYTHAKLKRSFTPNGPQTTLPGSYNGLVNTSATVTQAGFYRVYYYTANETESITFGGPISIGASISGTCHSFNGLSSGGPYCPTPSANSGAQLPKVYHWTSDAASCTLNGQSASTNGLVTIQDSSDFGTYTLSCNWADGTTVTAPATYAGLQPSDSPFCSTPPATTGHPIIIEQ